MDQPKPSQPREEVSPKLKLFVIILTIITSAAFCVFLVILFNKTFSPAKSGEWAGQLIQVGDRFKSEGLGKQAIEQYEQFLAGGKVKPATRAKVSYSIGEIYLEQGNCPQALVWFFQVELADPEIGRKNNVDAKIASCLQQVRGAAQALK